jgi:putative colanic acid biosynthesis acetyltransferase WcaF
MRKFYKEIYQSEFLFSEKLARYIWNVVYFVAFKFSPRICFSWRSMLLRVFGAKIGAQCKIYPRVKIWLPKKLNIGDGVIIGDDVNLYNIAPIVIGPEVTISQEAFLCTASHNIESQNRELVSSSITIERGAWIFAGAFISMGIKIEEGAIIGAKSVVTKNVATFDVVAGNPAKVIKKRKVDWLN